MNELDNAEREIERLSRENRGMTEMLAQVLYQIGEPVVVPKETMKKGFESDMQVVIDDNQEGDSFVFRLEEM